MPVTPFHFGLGALAKSIAPKRFSFQVFFLSQIMMDVQPGINLILGWRPLHGWTHTYLGALCVGMFTALVWRIWERIRPNLFATSAIHNLVLITSCFFGTLSHVWLDAQYHQDMWQNTPDWARLLEQNQVEGFCLAAVGIAGIIVVIRLLAKRIYRRMMRT